MNYSEKQWLDRWLKNPTRKYAEKSFRVENENNEFSLNSYFIFAYSWYDIYSFGLSYNYNTDTRFAIKIKAEMDYKTGRSIKRLSGDHAFIKWLGEKKYIKGHKHIDHSF